MKKNDMKTVEMVRKSRESLPYAVIKAGGATASSISG
jgi:hypothetical protein